MPSDRKVFLARMDPETEAMLPRVRDIVAASLGLESSTISQSMLLRLGLVELERKHSKPDRKKKEKHG